MHRWRRSVKLSLKKPLHQYIGLPNITKKGLNDMIASTLRKRRQHMIPCHLRLAIHRAKKRNITTTTRLVRDPATYSTF
jgi:hypothetical protein